MIETLGIIFGLVARLVQYYLNLMDKQRERKHEAVMYDKQIALSKLSIEAEKDLRKMDSAQVEQNDADMAALMNVLQKQTDDASKIGGWVAKLSSTVRPVITYWLLAIYFIVKIFTFVMVMRTDPVFGEIVSGLYTEFDGALLGSVIGFWFADRSLRKRK